jgi:hypothetical protein
MNKVSIESFHLKNDILYVEAWVDDIVVTSRATLRDPAEYGPALCSAEMMVDLEDEEIDYENLNEETVIFLIDQLDPEWIVIDTSDVD